MQLVSPQNLITFPSKNSISDIFLYIFFTVLHTCVLVQRNLKKCMTEKYLDCFYVVWSAFPPSCRAFLLIAIPTQPYPHSLLQRRRILKSPQRRSSSAVTWGPTAFARNTASAKLSAPLVYLRRQKVKHA